MNENLNLRHIEKCAIEKAIRLFPDDPIRLLADKLKVTERTLYRKIKEHQIPYFELKALSQKSNTTC